MIRQIHFSYRKCTHQAYKWQGLVQDKSYNARLRGWQRTTTKLKHNNHNHRGSMGLETPRVDSPS
ncbi:hypothetical protein DYT77_17925 [Vibrio cholerae]|nr:hypothetical protein [Vibrio cholerae]